MAMRRTQKDRAVGQAQDFSESLYQLRRLSDIRPVNETSGIPERSCDTSGVASVREGLVDPSPIESLWGLGCLPLNNAALQGEALCSVMLWARTPPC
jgi:hypothetical protein